ncbi:hypothetical protein BX616_007810 [Lobosporangium transversale]|nr:hypothetical protein BX616_007810 [Lobosporangium transversale]
MPVSSATNWADEVDGEEMPQTFTDANGITTTIEYKTNEDGKKVKTIDYVSGTQAEFISHGFQVDIEEKQQNQGLNIEYWITGRTIQDSK